jgi:hypothetical protein
MSLAGMPQDMPRPLTHGVAPLVRPLEVAGPTSSAIDELMARASGELARGEYFAAEATCLLAVRRCSRDCDFERLARVVLPLQESRRQIRQLACDAGRTTLLRRLPGRGAALEPGCCLLEAPILGVEARAFRDFARGKRVPVLVLCKEPTTSAGKWPIVGVGSGQPFPVVARVLVDPPEHLKGVKDLSLVPSEQLPDASWFMATQEALGDAAIVKVRLLWPADHRVFDLLEYLDAVPDHEKLHQALEQTCREATVSPRSPYPRRRPLMDDPYSF